jgi:ribosomal protein L11 methyltransferase
LKISLELFRLSDILDYKEINIQLYPWDENIAGILVAMLSSLGFESFIDNGAVLSGYVPLHLFNRKDLEATIQKILKGGIKYSQTEQTIKDKNWNEIWEHNYDMVIIDQTCQIRAPFHDRLENIPYSILIEPKMSFGTGHHATTSLMISSLLKLDVYNKKILDMGCGTGVLAILASKMGARSVVAIDIEEWAFKNTIENISLNSATNVKPIQGSRSTIKNLTFNIIMANINRNVLLDDMPYYANSLKDEGLLLLSGFFESDVLDIVDRAHQCNLTNIQTKHENKWACVLFSK